METVTCDGKTYDIEYQQIKVDDLVYDKNSESTFTADVWEADDLGWVVIKTH